MAGIRIELLLLLTGTLLLFPVQGWESLDRTQLLNFYETGQWGEPKSSLTSTDESAFDNEDDEAIPEDAFPEFEGAATTDNLGSFADYGFQVDVEDSPPRNWATGTDAGFQVDFSDSSPRSWTSDTCPRSSGLAVVCSDAGFKITLPGSLSEVKILGSEVVVPIMRAPESCGYKVDYFQKTLTVPFTGCNVKHADGYSLQLLHVDEFGLTQVATASCEERLKLNHGLLPRASGKPRRKCGYRPPAVYSPLQTYYSPLQTYYTPPPTYYTLPVDTLPPTTTTLPPTTTTTTTTTTTLPPTTTTTLPPTTTTTLPPTTTTTLPPTTTTTTTTTTLPPTTTTLPPTTTTTTTTTTTLPPTTTTTLPPTTTTTLPPTTTTTLPPTTTTTLPPTTTTTLPPTNSNCAVTSWERVNCGPPGISYASCEKLGCCVDYSALACYYPLDECTADQHFVFAIRANSASINFDPTKLIIPGNPQCKPVLVNDMVAIFKFKITECGAHAYEIGGTKIYLAEVQTIVKAISLKYGVITRSDPLRYMVECRYSITGTAAQSLVSVGYMVKTPSSSLPSSVISTGLYGVQLRIAKDQTYSTYFEMTSQPLRLLLGKPVYLELRLLSPKPDAVILVNYCLAYPRSATNALVLIYEGCANPFDPNVSILKVSDLPTNRYQRRFMVQAFQFMDQKTNQYLDEEICFMCSTEVCRPSEKTCAERCFDGSALMGGDDPAFQKNTFIKY